MGRRPIEKICCVCLNMGLDFNRLTKKDENKITLLNKFKKCILDVLWLSSFYLCLECMKTLDIIYTFRERCIQSDLIRKGQKNTVNQDDTTCKNVGEDIKEEISGDEERDASDSLEDFEDATDANDTLYSSSSVKSDDECEKEDKGKRKKKRTRHEIDDEVINETKVRRRKTKRKFGCEKCEKSFLASTKLVAHCTEDHGMASKDIKPFSCDRCPQRFSTSSNLWQHIKYHEGVKSNMCSYCGKGFITKTDLSNHEKKHLNRREYKCESCGKSFNTHKDIRSHRLIVHTDSSHWKYVCEICMKPFPIKSNYDSHMRRHMGDKKFACHLCEKKFTTKCDLQRHTRSHSDVREHKCPHCEKEYKDERVLKVHKAKVHGIGVGKVKIPVRERNYACQFCPKAYYAKNKLTRHLYTHSGEKPFDCPICEKKFNDKSYVKQHLRNTHNVESQDWAERPPRMSYLNINAGGQDVRPPV